MTDATVALDAALADAGVDFERVDASTFVAVLPGVHRLRTEAVFSVGQHAVTITAFVARAPDEHHEDVYRWLLERNGTMYGVAFAVDALGDIYLRGRASLDAITPDEIDRLLGCVLEYADASFNTILELGFGGAIRREWVWRTSRGESTANLEAFRHLAPGVDERHSGSSGTMGT